MRLIWYAYGYATEDKFDGLSEEITKSGVSVGRSRIGEGRLLRYTVGGTQEQIDQVLPAVQAWNADRERARLHAFWERVGKVRP